MSNSLTRARVIYSGKMALVAAMIFGSAISSQAQADELTPTQRAAIEQHDEILNHQQQASEQEIISSIQTNLDEQMEQAEEHFMETACAEHDRQYDNDTQVCY
ncbi:hypothetical protein K0I73_01940 [Shewanella mesophila]|uniref:hypothetical protein n=1 Tax=Shewanella mesophila TaxID=2864208 RepID=UPI001C657B52|nr:hypothetical protein [Shewanella mesophila]QYJ86540.1 hypothetical protein K0I73_01940 [Shewanella mesophila]